MKYKIKPHIESWVYFVVLSVICLVLLFSYMTGATAMFILIIPMLYIFPVLLNIDQWIIIDEHKVQFWQKPLGKNSHLSWSLPFTDIKNVSKAGAFITLQCLYLEEYKFQPFKSEEVFEIINHRYDKK
jgi:hypothetical protein